MSTNNSPEKKIPKLTFKAFDELRDLSTLKVSRFQRNKHPTEQIEQLAKNMESLGTNQAIHIDTQYDEVMFGHGRWEAALKNGYTHFPVIYHTYESDEVLYLTVQADNGLSQWSELDLAAINADLPNIGPLDINLLGIKDFKLDLSEKSSFVPEDLAKTYNIMISCHDEASQKEIFEELSARNLSVKIL